MIVYPAIDLRQGRVVRLRQGDPAAEAVYGEDPAAVARRWTGEGANWLHVVNLDGAFAGEEAADLAAEMPINLMRLAEIRRASPAARAVRRRRAHGRRRGPRAGARCDARGPRHGCRPPAADGRRRPGALRPGADRRRHRRTRRLGGRAGLAGDVGGAGGGPGAGRWRPSACSGSSTPTSPATACWPAPTSRPRQRLARASGLKVIASGGVAGLADIRALAEHEADGIEGVIVGQALYSGALDLQAAIAAAAGAKSPGPTEGDHEHGGH